LAEQDRTVLFWGALNVRLSWDAMLVRWSIMLAMACCGVYAFYLNVVVPIQEVMAERARAKAVAAKREARRKQAEAEREELAKERRELRQKAEEAEKQKKAAPKPKPKPKPRRRCNQKRLANLVARAHELGNPTEAEIEEALLDNGDHAGKAMTALLELSKKKEKNKYVDERERRKGEQTQVDDEIKGTHVGDSVTKHGNHSYYFAHHSRALEPDLKAGDFQMNAPKLLKKEKKAVKQPVKEEATTEKPRLNIENYAWAEVDGGKAQVTIPLRAIGELREDQIKLEWTERWVRISITDYESADHFFEVRKTYCELRDAQLARKPHKLVLTLEKKSSFDQWYKLHHPGVIEREDDD